MGRTVPSFRLYLDSLASQWKNFRRALRKEDRDAFDEVLNLARRLASASSYQAPPDPMDAVLLSIAVEQQKEINHLRRRLDDEGLDSRRLTRLSVRDDEDMVSDR